MSKKLVNRDERVVFFFGKKRRLNDSGEFKIGRMTVHVRPDRLRRLEGLWHATLRGYGTPASVVIHGPSARSPAAATKKLERRINSLHRALCALYDIYV